MFELPQIMRDAQMLARHAGAAQTQTAKNMANADTPGYRGQVYISFADAMSRGAQGDLRMRQTLPGHLAGSERAHFVLRDTGDPVDLNGNNVSIEAEMVRAASAQSQHTTAMTVYRASLEMMRTALGRGR